MKREANSREKKLIESYKNWAQKFDLQNQISSGLEFYYNQQVLFAKEKNLSLDGVFDLKSLEIYKKHNKRIKRWISLLDRGEIGISPNGNTDFSIVAPQGTNDDQLMMYNSLGWILIAGGIVLVALAITTIKVLYDELEYSNSRLEDCVKTNDDKFCSDPNSPTCQAWLKRKVDTGLNNTKTVIDQIKDMISGIGTAIKTGSEWGFMIAIPLIAWIILGKK